MVEFVHDDHVVEIRFHMIPEGQTVAGLDGHEYMVHLGGMAARYCQFSKIGVFQYLTETRTALL